MALISKKACKKCCSTKELSAFQRYEKTLDGYRGVCRDCRNARRRELRGEKLQNAEWVMKVRRYQREWQHRYRTRNYGGGTPEQRKTRILAKARWRAKNPHKIAAHEELHRAVRHGEISKKCCEVCGERKVEAHHPDYSQPLRVVWLCKKHHMERHRKAA